MDSWTLISIRCPTIHNKRSISKMKVHTSFQRHEPDTIRGEAISVTQVFSSFDKREIDMLQNQ